MSYYQWWGPKAGEVILYFSYLSLRSPTVIPSRESTTRPILKAVFGSLRIDLRLEPEASNIVAVFETVAEYYTEGCPISALQFLFTTYLGRQPNSNPVSSPLMDRFAVRCGVVATCSVM
jgi:hypothetical protein